MRHWSLMVGMPFDLEGHKNPLRNKEVLSFWQVAKKTLQVFSPWRKMHISLSYEYLHMPGIKKAIHWIELKNYHHHHHLQGSHFSWLLVCYLNESKKNINEDFASKNMVSSKITHLFSLWEYRTGKQTWAWIITLLLSSFIIEKSQSLGLSFLTSKVSLDYQVFGLLI